MCFNGIRILIPAVAKSYRKTNRMENASREHGIYSILGFGFIYYFHISFVLELIILLKIEYMQTCSKKSYNLLYVK